MAKATRLRFTASWLAGVCSVFLAFVGHVSAQVTLDRYSPAPWNFDGFMLARPEAPGHMRFGAQLQLDYARDPLVWLRNVENPDAGSYNVVQNQLVFHPIVSLGLFDRLLVFAHMPINAVVASGDNVPDELSSTYKDFATVGGFSLGARLHLLGSRETPLALAVQAALGLPFGKWLGGATTSFVSETTVTGNLAALLELHLHPRLRIGGSVGVLLRKTVDAENLDIGSDFNFVVGAGFLLLDTETKIEAIFELFGSSLLSDVFGNTATPIEALLGAKAHFDGGFSAGLAGDLGLTSGYGSPNYRLLAMLGWTMPGKPAVHDRDEDGIPDEVDQCPEKPEDKDGVRDGDGCPDLDSDHDGLDDDKDQCPDKPEDKDDYQDDDGCPDPDNDQDGLLDAHDKCPNDAEDKDGFQDDDGCPEPDNDQDGIPDTTDKCPGEAEDKDNFQDEDGCPDPDNDQDGLLDAADKCPNEAETKNGKDDDDGCPDLVRVDNTQIVTLKPVRFETNSTTIHHDSEDMLREIAALLIAHPEIALLSIEGHTDSSGKPAANLKLSAGRAAAVREFLIAAGVAGERLTSAGLGDTQPIADNATAEGRTKNRRVQFIIVPPAAPSEPTEEH